MAAPDVASVSAWAVTDVDGNIAIPAPSGVTAGTLVVALVRLWWAGAVLPTVDDLTAPGWQTSQVYPAYDGSDSYTSGLFFCYRYATGADSGTYAFTGGEVGGQPASNSRPYTGGFALRITGGPTSGDPFVDTLQGGFSVHDASGITVESFTPGGDESLLLAFVGVAWGALTISGPDGWSYVVDHAAAEEAEVWQAQQATAAPTGTLTWSWPDRNVDPASVAVAAIRGDASGAVGGTLAAAVPAVTVSVPTAAVSGTTSVPHRTGALTTSAPTVTASVPTATLTGTTTIPHQAGTLAGSVPTVTVSAPTSGLTGTTSVPHGSAVLDATTPAVTVGPPTSTLTAATTVPTTSGTLAAQAPAVTVGPPTAALTGTTTIPAGSGVLAATLPTVTVSTPTAAWAGTATRPPGAGTITATTPGVTVAVPHATLTGTTSGSTTRDITVTHRAGPTGHPMRATGPTGRELTVSGPTRNPMTVTGPRS